MHRRLLLLLALPLVLLSPPDPAHAAKNRPFYLSLGDSLAWGYSKAADGSVVQTRRDFTGLVAAAARRDRRYPGRLDALRLGCPGETTRTFRFGGRCKYAGFRSQMAAARAFLRANRRRTAFVTLSLGGDNINDCVRGLSLDLGCVQRGTAQLNRDISRIYRGLRRAAGKRVGIATATLYDPFLAFYLRGTDYHELALLTVDLVHELNWRIRRAARSRSARIRVADAFAAFRTEQLGSLRPVGGQPAPAAVAAICRLTFMCRAAPVGPDLHPTAAGYRRIAGRFVDALRLRPRRR